MNYNDYEQIKKLIDNYFLAVSEADTNTLKSIFHESASMYGYLGDAPVLGTPEIFYADLESKPSMKEQNISCTMVLKNIDIHNSVATASIFVDNFYGASKVLDLFHLMKINNDWKIVCKTFTTL